MPNREEEVGNKGGENHHEAEFPERSGGEGAPRGLHNGAEREGEHEDKGDEEEPLHQLNGRILEDNIAEEREVEGVIEGGEEGEEDSPA